MQLVCSEMWPSWCGTNNHPHQVSGCIIHNSFNTDRAAEPTKVLNRKTHFTILWQILHCFYDHADTAGEHTDVGLQFPCQARAIQNCIAVVWAFFGARCTLHVYDLLLMCWSEKLQRSNRQAKRTGGKALASTAGAEEMWKTVGVPIRRKTIAAPHTQISVERSLIAIAVLKTPASRWSIVVARSIVSN